MRFKNLLFDLDGTLVDSKLGIVNSLNFALPKYGIITEQEDLTSFIGPPLMNTLVNRFSFNEKKAAEAVASFRTHYGKYGVHNAQLYANVKSVLRELSSLGCILYIATSKPLIFANLLLERFDVAQFFKHVSGSNLQQSTFDTKQRIIEDVLKTCRISDISSCVMIGDRIHDIEAAQTFGMYSVGVSHGYGTFEELQCADFVVNNMSGLCDFLSGRK